MKNLIISALCALALIPSLLQGQTVFSDIQVTGGIQVGTGPNYISLAPGGGTLTIGGGDGTYASDAQNFSLGVGNVFSNTSYSHTFGAYNNYSESNCIFSFGFGNTVSGTFYDFIFGHENTVSGCIDGYILGNHNVISNSDSTQVYHMGSGLNSSFSNRYTIILGFNNLDIQPAEPLFDMNDEETPLLVLGNGRDDSTRSNALVTQKSGRTTIANRNFVPTGTPATPAQPHEALVVQGAATMRGDTLMQGQVTMSRRQGDIWMGSFGRSEDAGPAN